MPRGLEVEEILARHLGDAASSFSVGAPGAIAEFHRAADEAPDLDDRTGLRIATARGALGIGDCAGVVPLAYETPGRDPERWRHGVVFCLPEDRARGARREVLSEIGPDAGAVREADRGALLFDMGLGAANVDFCVRTADAALIDTLRAGLGRSVLEPGSPAMGAVLGANPHRIAISALARVEVFQPIGRTVTPEGPHTHVLPDLLATGRTHEAAIPVPAGMLPCLSLYPASPLVDGLGREKPFERARLYAFLPCVEAWAAPEHVREKRRVAEALDAGLAPETFDAPDTPIAAAARKVALRQRRRIGPPVPLLASWLEAFDPPRLRRRSRRSGRT